ncbi:MAG: glutathione S-transferase N-terminal domain-containing protein [Alphaproteobacteria bacterium]|nr:glutathione S-transferase N-terminal domain-containing protein [Alphaproteobacteria bacterium]
MKLISASPSPYARKVRIVLHEKGIPFDLETTVPWNADTVTGRHNPLEKIPILIPDGPGPQGGEPVFESSYILEWLEVHHPHPPMMPADPVERLAARRLEVVGDGVCDAFVLYFFEMKRTPEHRSAAWIDRQLRKIKGGLAELERLVPENGFCVGGRFGLADIAAGCTADYLTLRYPEFAWQPGHPKLAALRLRLLDRPSFQMTAPTAQQIEPAVI